MSDWTSNFSALRDLPDETRQLLLKNASVMQLSAGKKVYGPHIVPENFLLLISGVIRVQQTSESGREIVLFRVNDGESCALTTACLMSFEPYTAEAIVERNATAVAIPRQTFDELIARSAEFRRFVFTSFGVRIAGLFHLIDEILSNRIDIRFSEKLLELAGDGNVIAVTHQQLAHELGTAREVITRQVGEFQRRNWIESTRGKIIMRDRDAIISLSKQR